jgi:hypothetical protein
MDSVRSQVKIDGCGSYSVDKADICAGPPEPF